MDCPVHYQMILKDAFNPKVQEYIDVIAFCTDVQNDMYNCKYGHDGTEATISVGNIQKAYAHTGPIYKLLYF